MKFLAGVGVILCLTSAHPSEPSVETQLAHARAQLVATQIQLRNARLGAARYQQLWIACQANFRTYDLPWLRPREEELI